MLSGHQAAAPTVTTINAHCGRRTSPRLILWSEVRAWVMNSPKVFPSRHRRRTKDEIAAVKVKQKKAWWVGGPGRIRTSNQSIMSRML